MADIVVLPVNEAVTVESSTTESVVTGLPGNTVTNQEIYNVVIEVESVSTLLAGQPGPQGPTGLSEDSMAYARQTDFVGEDVIYKGEAEAGTLTSSPYWRVRKITILNDDISETWADGNTNFDNIWDNRASLTYI
jgi:hypothetical protein